MEKQTERKVLVDTANALRAKGLTFKEAAKEMQKKSMKNSWGNPVSAFNVQSYTRKIKKPLKAKKVAKKTRVGVSLMKATPDLGLIAVIASSTLTPDQKIRVIRGLL